MKRNLRNHDTRPSADWQWSGRSLLPPGFAVKTLGEIAALFGRDSDGGALFEHRPNYGDDEDECENREQFHEVLPTG